MEANWKITVLVNNYTRGDTFRAEHGLSLLLEDGAAGPSILLDAGASGDVLLHNARLLGVDWNRLQAVVLSHGHWDHAGGLEALYAELDRPVPLIHHPDAFLPKASSSPAFHSIGTPFPSSEKAVPFPARNDIELADDLWITGEIPRTEETDREASAGFYRSKDGVFQPDPVPDDRSVVIGKPGRGFFLVTGCCHSGLVNTLNYVKEKSADKKTLGIIGGIHTIGASAERLASTIRKLKEEAPEFIAPIHCSGAREAAILFRELGEDVVIFPAVGDSFTV